MTKQKLVKMDYAAGKPVDPRVIEAMLPFMQDMFGNPSSISSLGQGAKKGLDEARKKVAELINAERQESVIFTSGATESNNLAIKGVANRSRDRGTKIITSTV